MQSKHNLGLYACQIPHQHRHIKVMAVEIVKVNHVRTRLPYEINKGRRSISGVPPFRITNTAYQIMPQHLRLVSNPEIHPGEIAPTCSHNALMPKLTQMISDSHHQPPHRVGWIGHSIYFKNFRHTPQNYTNLLYICNRKD